MKKKNNARIAKRTATLNDDTLDQKLDERADKMIGQLEEKDPLPPIWYVAGRIEKDWQRFGLIPCGLDEPYECVAEIRTPTNYRIFRYSGPYTVGCDHGCSHAGFTQQDDTKWRDVSDVEMVARHATRGTRTHGCASSYCVGRISPRDTMCRALDGISKADYVFVWIKDQECFGTLVEVGYALALKKKIYIAYHPSINPRGELWFAFGAATKIVKTEDPGNACLGAMILERGSQLVEHRRLKDPSYGR